jgi:hypothetical protein
LPLDLQVNRKARGRIDVQQHAVLVQ